MFELRNTAVNLSKSKGHYSIPVTINMAEIIATTKTTIRRMKAV